MTPTRPEAALAAALRTIGLMEEPLPGQSIEEFGGAILAALRDLGYSVVPSATEGEFETVTEALESAWDAGRNTARTELARLALATRAILGSGNRAAIDEHLGELETEAAAVVPTASPDPTALALMEDGKRWQAAEAEGHIVTFTRTGYGLQHPPSCRPDLNGCRFNRHLAVASGPAKKPGRYSMRWEGRAPTYQETKP
jgi:hypothetical protein